MRLLFIGAGAIGTYVGGSLAVAGHDIAYSEQPAAAAAIAEAGLRLTREGRTSSVRTFAIHASAAEALAAGPYDACVFALKSFDTSSALDELIATGLPVPPVLSLQNGVDNEPLIARRLGAGQVITGTVTTAVGKPGTGQVIEEKRRGIGIGTDHPLGEPLIAALNDARLNGRGYRRPGAMKWSKLLTNLQGNATSAILDEPVARLFADRRLYEVEIAVLRECLAVMDALGYQPVDLPGTPVRALALAATRIPRLVGQPVLTRLLGGGRGAKMPSFHIDLYSGRGRTEVRYLNGAVVRHGDELGVPTPVNRVLTETLEALSSGSVPLDTYRHNPEALLALL
ncbi:ketopantoate reductase family protein [Propionicimonas sp.]|uniref:ketopantoate reductase family protein n=1 Tax=Propionicimonas sp. TaxID=1955623 RepID=UPI0039E32543